MAISKIIKSKEPDEILIETESEELQSKPFCCGCKNRKVLVITIIIAIILALIWGLFRFNIIPVNLLSQLHKNYQAVFMTNGQVYFGKLYRENSQYPILKDIYYLQVTQPPQPLQEGQTPPANVNLVKLGAELHGPQDEMRINRDNILFIEDLKSDSRVLQAIEQFKAANQ